MTSQPKRQQGVDKDRISELPDGMIFHILSFLPTKDSVRTGSLSKRWKDIWACVPNLDFNEEDFDSLNKFLMFVERVFYLRESSKIQKLSLLFGCDTDDLEDYEQVERFSRVKGWILTAIRRNVVELDLCVDTDKGLPFQLPENLFLCKTLESLELSGFEITNIPTSGCCPRLKVLSIHGRLADVVDSLISVLPKLPVLEHLTILGELDCEWRNGWEIKICAPELKTFKLNLIIGDRHNKKYNIFLDAPKLEDLSLGDFWPTDSKLDFHTDEANSLVKAKISGRDVQHHIDVAVAWISDVKYMRLNLTAPMVQLKASLPAFNNLNRLTLSLIDGYCWGLLTKFLERSPNLEHLVFEHACGWKRTEKDFKCVEFHPPEVVPRCLSMHLKTITMRGMFKGRYDEAMKVAEYLLKNARVLKKMTVYSPEKGLSNKFSMFQRSSATCQVEIVT